MPSPTPPIAAPTSGDIVVPIAQIVDLLKTKLTQTDIDALLSSLLAGAGPQQVRPGDLITSELMNWVLAQLADHSKRIAFLEGSVGKDGDVVITELVPPDGNVKVGETLQVKGKNFQYSKGLLRAYVDRYAIGGFMAGTTDELLIFPVPQQINDVPADGRPAILTVNNSQSSAQAVLFLRPGMTLAGYFELNEIDTKPSGATPKGGQRFTMTYEAVSHLNLDTSVQVSGTVSGPANSADWQKNVSVLNTDETVIPSGSLFLKQGERKQFLVRIDPIPLGTPDLIAFSLTAQVSAGAVSQKLGVSFTTNVAYVPPDPTVLLNFVSAEIKPPGARGSVDANGIQLAAGAGAKIVFAGKFEQAGSYDFTLTPPTGWQAALTDGTPSTVVIQPNEVVNGPATKPLVIAVAPGTNAASVGELDLKLQKQGAANARKVAMTVQLLT